MIEEAILDADRKGIKVLSLGLLNQGEELNIYGGLYVRRYPKLNVKIVDGSSLAAAVVLNSIPKGTTQVLLRGKLTKVAYGIAFTLCQQGVQVRFFVYIDLGLSSIHHLKSWTTATNFCELAARIENSQLISGQLFFFHFIKLHMITNSIFTSYKQYNCTPPDHSNSGAGGGGW